MWKGTRTRALAARALLGVVALALLGSGSAGARETLSPAAGPASGELRIEVVDARGEGVDARVRVLTSASPSPRDRIVWVSAAGTYARLPAGAHGLLATRGPEWSIARTRVDVKRDATAHVRMVLEHEVDPDGFVGCDLHVHADPSPDSDVPVDLRVRSLLAEGIGFAVATDHNAVTDYAPSARHTALRTVRGVEITTWAPEVGHFNAYPMDRAPRHRGRAPRELFDTLHAADPETIVQVNHPRLDGHIAYFELAGLDADGALHTPGFSLDFDALEVWNGFELARPEASLAVMKEWLRLLENGHSMVATGGSDAHGLTDHYAGYPRTMARGTDERALLRAIRDGRTFVTNGPVLLVSADGAGEPGLRGVRGPTRTGEAAVLRVEVRAPAWMDVARVEVWSARGLVEQRVLGPRPGPGGRRGVEYFEVPRSEERVVVRVLGDRPMTELMGREDVLAMAFTNPVLL